MKMENTFELSPEHTIMLNDMDNEIKSAVRHVVNTLGYYSAISYFITEFNMTEDKAKILADIGCYVLIDYSINNSMEEEVKTNREELERLKEIYTQINQYTKEKYGMTIFDLQAFIKTAEEFDNMFSTDGWEDEFNDE